MNLKNEINSRFLGERTRVDLLADLTTKEITQINEKLAKLESTMGVMQEAFVKLEIALRTFTEDLHAKPKRRSKKD